MIRGCDLKGFVHEWTNGDVLIVNITVLFLSSL